MFLILLARDSRCFDHLDKSKPPNIGEPKKNAIVIIDPRRIPTITNRLFIITNILCLNKKQLNNF